MIKDKKQPHNSSVHVIYSLWLALSTLLILSLTTSLALFLVETLNSQSLNDSPGQQSGLTLIAALIISILFSYGLLFFLTKEYLYKVVHQLFSTSINWFLVSLVIGIGVAVVTLQLSQIYPPEMGRSSTFDIIKNGGFYAQALLIIGTVILAPFFEEYLFRGLIYDSMHARFGVYLAIFLSAVVFMAFHLIEYYNYWVGLAAIFVLGICLAAIRERSGSILNPIICHASYNLSILMLV
ncbi:hypothetical protein GCM10009123_14570 [Kangiella japonica]|uniref:CAAX prenyl protease 2/Lysostaphin resistance protein A-like domain-containing protein n=1 Tax=Kangiella japonica TaxID=647384 RepID=A0ABN0T071_9GAMM